MRKTPVYIWLLILLLTLLVSVISATLLFTLGLILIEFLLYPLALGISALLTGLTAVLLSNWLYKDNQQTPLKPVIIRCEGTAVLLVILLEVGLWLKLLAAPPIIFSSAVALILTLVATYSAAQLRQESRARPQPARRIIIWLLLAAAAVPVTIFIASLFGWAGA